MSIMTRYVLTELTLFFLAALVSLTSAAMLGGVVNEAIRQGLPPDAVLRLIPYILVLMLRITVPVALLLATTSVFSRMSGFNEVVALKALGISPMAILWPTFILSFLVSLVAVWLNDVAVTWGNSGMQRVVVDAVEEIAYGMLRTERRYSSSQFSINVKRVEGRRLIHPIVTFRPRGSFPAVTIDAEDAELRADHEENVLKIFLRNATVEWEDRGRIILDEFEHEIPLRDASRAEETSRSPAWLALARVDSELVNQARLLEQRKQELAATAAYQMMTGDFEGLTGGEWKRWATELAGIRTQICKLRTEPYRRWAAGFSCLCFALVGAPMAIWFRNRDFLQSFFLCFLPILIVYYPLLMSTLNGAKDGRMHPIAIWAGNGLLALWGVWMLRKVLRH